MNQQQIDTEISALQERIHTKKQEMVSDMASLPDDVKQLVIAKVEQMEAAVRDEINTARAGLLQRAEGFWNRINDDVARLFDHHKKAVPAELQIAPTNPQPLTSPAVSAKVAPDPAST